MWSLTEVEGHASLAGGRPLQCIQYTAEPEVTILDDPSRVMPSCHVNNLRLCRLKPEQPCAWIWGRKGYVLGLYTSVVCPTCIFARDDKALTRVRARRLLEGGTLWNILKWDQRMPEVDVRIVARRLLEALAAMADIGVAHMDVKPMNMGLARPWDRTSTTLFDMGSWRRTGETPAQNALACNDYLPCCGRVMLIIRNWCCTLRGACFWRDCHSARLL